MAERGMTESFIAAVAQGHLNRRREKLASINTAQDAAARQAQVREICSTTLGAFPERSPLKPRLIAQLPHEGYRIDALTYESTPGVVVTANLYVPGDADGPYPTVVCIPPYTPQGKAHAECQRLCQLLSRRGMAALVIDLPGQGERLEFYDSTLRGSFTGKRVAAEHAHLGNVLLLTGHNLTNWMIWDAMRGLDALLELNVADAQKLGVIGCAGGASIARLMSCLDPRIAVAATVADHFDAEWGEGGDEDHVHYSALAHGVTALDTLMAFAPKPLLIAHCAQDRLKGNIHAHIEELSSFYALLNGKEHLSLFEGDGPAGYVKFIRARATDHFARAFGLADERVREPETPPETPEMLYCTETGQVSNSLNAKSLFAYHKDISRDVPPSLPVPRDADAAVKLQSEIRDRFVPFLKLPEPAGPVESQIESRSIDWGYAVEKGRLVLADGLFAPYSFYSLPEGAEPASGKKTAPVVLVLHERGIAAVSSQGPWMNGFAAAGFHVMAIDVCGIGETRLQPKAEVSDAYETLLCGAESQWARRALHAGISLFGLRVYNVLRTLEYLRTRWEVDKERISIAGVGRGALWGLYASALDGTVTHTVLLRGLDAYRSLIERRHHNHHFSLYLPGCLQEYDLPHVSACIAPRPLTIVNPVNSRKERKEAEKVEREYALTAAIYKLRGAPNNLRIINTDSAPETFAAIRDGVVNSDAP